MNVSRRRLLSGVGAGAGLLAATACESAVGLQARVATKSAVAKPGGTAKLGFTRDLVPGNLFTNTGPAITAMMGLVFDTLIRYPRSGLTPQPALATAWEPTPDGRGLTLRLREDVRFHTGRPFTSADVEFSLRTYADPRWNGQLKGTAAAITGFDTSHPHQVTLSFAHPLSNIFDLLDTAPMLDKETADEIGTGKKFIGTGPFRFTSWRPGTDLRFARNPDYFVPGRPYLDEVYARIIPESSTLISALKSGQVHFADTLGPRDVEAATKNPAITALPATGAELEAYVGANVTAAPLDDPRIRQGIAYALDRDRVVAEVFRGQGFASALPWPKDSPAFDAGRAARYGYDPARSRALIASAGGAPSPIPLTYPGDDTAMSAIAQIVQNNLGDLGIEAYLDPVDHAQFTKQLIGARFPGLWVTNHSWAQMSPSTLSVSAYPFNARKNASHFVAPDYTGAADAAWHLARPTGPEAATAYGALSDELLEHLFLIEIGVYWSQFAVSGALRGVGYRRRRELDLTEAFLA